MASLATIPEAAAKSPFSDAPSSLFSLLLLPLCLPLTLLPPSLRVTLSATLTFIHACFLFPLISLLSSLVGGSTTHSTGQQGRLDAFYARQADVYDRTRSGLLRGRETMMRLVASHWRVQEAEARRVPGADKRSKIWVDIGGGTGWNVEQMDAHLPISTFDAVYVVDLCAPLLEIARKRFAARGWTNVHVLHQDASRFVLPEWERGIDPRGSVSLVTMSYSLSMIPTYLETLDRIDQILDPATGLLGAVDFYSTDEAGGTPRERAIGTARRKVNFWSHVFWTSWFSFDHVNLGIARRNYLEYKFGTVKSYNGRNNFIIPKLVQIPYYVFLGSSRYRPEVSSARKLHHSLSPVLRQDNELVPPYATPLSPWHDPNAGGMLEKVEGTPEELFLGDSGYASGGEGDDSRVERPLEVGMLSARLSPFDYQIRKSSWRMRYSEQTIHKQFRTHIYGWTWEDPDCDVRDLGITDGDSILAITSAGDNVLHYAIRAKVEIQSVDMNPCQGHILELKLAASQSLDYADYWQMFGEGRHPRFEELLSSKMAPYMSTQAYAYWKVHADEFADNFFLRGYSGWAIRLGRAAFALAGVRGEVKRLIAASTTSEQQQVWNAKLRPVIMSPLLKLILGSPIFCWNALGVPKNQLACLLEDGTIEDFIAATLDPVPGMATLRNGAYHYLLCLNGKYTRASCPLYLTQDGFEALKANAGSLTQGIRLHTDTILNVLRGLESESLSKIIVMDSLDWFDRIPPSTPLPTKPLKSVQEVHAGSPEAAYEELKSELDYEILEMRRVLKQGGYAIWRSAGKYPWYRQRFELAGFRVKAVAIRENGKGIDRVNMYASLWRAQKM